MSARCPKECWICGAVSSEGNFFEVHHPFGRDWDHTLLLCVRCHREIDGRNVGFGVRDVSLFKDAVQGLVEEGQWQTRWLFLKVISVCHQQASFIKKLQEKVGDEVKA